MHAAASAALRDVLHLEWFHDHVRIESFFFDGALDPTGGTVRPLEGPGLGLTLRTEDVEECRAA